MAITPLQDSDLVLQYIHGDEHALEELIHRHQKRIYSHIYKIVADHDVANDYFQETFIKIIQTIKLGRYNEEGKFLPWALRIAHNMIIDDIRKEKRHTTVHSLDKNRDIFDTIITEEKNQEEEFAMMNVLDRLKSLVDQLPEDQRQVVLLRHYGDLSFKEIAEETNVSVNTALGRMRYALLNLRKLMKEHNLELAQI